MDNEIKSFSVIAMLCDIYDKKLQKGQMGIVVEKLASDTYEVEFCDKNGQTIVSTNIKNQTAIQTFIIYCKQLHQTITSM